ncbi:MAG: copper transport protein [Thelocarpon impressellum]|nr:MAG: copper transport protein [Thelocarpon impressellum]
MYDRLFHLDYLHFFELDTRRAEALQFVPLTARGPTMAGQERNEDPEAGPPEGGKPSGKANLSKRCKAYRVTFKLALIVTLSHFEAPYILPESAKDQAMGKARMVLVESQKAADVRTALGLHPDIWIRLAAVLTKAIPVLERQSFDSKETITPTFAGSSSALIALNFVTLLKDVERINDLCTISRNMLATISRAQDMAADVRLDQLILRLIDVCVRVTARGYDGESGVRSEDKWQRVVNAYKKLLITCLQFLHNFVMNNERRKLLLWMDLFGSSPCADPSFMGRVDPAAYFQPGDYVTRDLTAALGDRDNEKAAGAADSTAEQPRNPVDPVGGVPLSRESQDALRAKLDAINDKISEINLEASDLVERAKLRAPANEAPKSKERANSAPAGSVGDHPGRPMLGPDGRARVDAFEDPLLKLKEEASHANASIEIPPTIDGRPVVSPLLVAGNFTGLDLDGVPMPEDDVIMSIRPEVAAKILNLCKVQIVDRLDDRRDIAVDDEVRVYEDDVLSDDVAGGVVGEDHVSEEAAHGSVEDDVESYQGPGDQERGLLTDIPLVLGPNEIEALPMIIQTGIVDAFASKAPEGITENMQAIRCNILIAQESGRHLLRELLIFVAAWDLGDEEIYFKMMMQIMEALLMNGLIPCAYGWFQEPKDIISPSQAVIIKLLTQIFRAKQSQLAATDPGAGSDPAAPRPPRTLPRIDVLAVRYIFSQFRLTVIPETCALIYLQGQIRAGRAEPDVFPLNLWDMERVYEGVYQFLEFFAVLTEAEEWKRLLVDWEMTHELVALLRELHDSIPPGRLEASAAEASSSAGLPAPAQDRRPPVPVAVERPYDPSPPSPPPPPPSQPGSPAPVAADNPEDFEWRNLKKLVVLVLSSLVWKCPAVQDQARQYGGVELVLSCCAYDAHNPYIREHSIMCLRFLLEGNRENMALVRELQPREVVPSEVLEQRGYETFIDQAGKVGLRPKPGADIERGTGG